MFGKKQTQLFERPASKQTGDTLVAEKSPFVNAGMKKAATTFSGNGAVKYSTTGNDFVDQFGKLGSYKVPREFSAISADMHLLWSQNQMATICFVFFIRMITRITSLFYGEKTETVQRGAGLKHEGIMRMVWIHLNAPETFWKNITLFISVGSWNDIIQMLKYDLMYNGWRDRQLDWDKFGAVLLAGLENEQTSNLVKKYLPQIRAKSKCKTLEAQADNLVAKWIVSSVLKLGEGAPAYKQYRQLKTSGTAHTWQQLISKGRLLEIDFKKIHGRALSQLVSSKFLTNNNLVGEYEKWLATQPVLKYTGYVHELLGGISKATTKFKQETINKQFDGLVELGRKNAVTKSGLIVVRDTSGSMGSQAPGTQMSCYDIGKALALYFSSFLDGAFKDAWIEFNSSAQLHTWKGKTVVEKWINDRTSFVGSTDFHSVIRLLISIKQQGVQEKDFPTGILCISDGEFNPAALGRTNVYAALDALLRAGFSPEYVSNFKIVLWNLQSNFYGRGTGETFETYGGVPNVFYFSGYEASIVAFLTGVEGKTALDATPTNAEELFNAAMHQEIMSLIEL